MKIYLITAGEYSEYRVIGAFTDKEKAERTADILSAYVEEFEANSPDFSSHKNLDQFRVTRYIDGTLSVTRVADEQFVEDTSEQDGHIWVSSFYSDEQRRRLSNPSIVATVWARDEDHARKIASDRIAQYIAEHEGIA